MDWGEIFFRLHHYCHLNRWEIYEYTLPQIAELMKHTNKHIEFQVRVMTVPLKAMFGGGGDDNENDYKEFAEEDIGMLSSMLSGR
ncbi:hypothetical protein [Desulfocucumis palustris]|uniref:hypothetical protein n=1 Tax=Desulfocucumis palustris TaxID=1898651 RepID=UPI000FFE4D71|nr:hypothetical protein [Desulfocucumis palustris]